jgi:hypothetical protein
VLTAKRRRTGIDRESLQDEGQIYQKPVKKDLIDLLKGK